MVHKNLLLEVNFLPLSGMDQVEDTCAIDVSFISDESDQADDGDGTTSMLGALDEGDNTQDLSVSRNGVGLMFYPLLTHLSRLTQSSRIGLIQYLVLYRCRC